MYANPFFTLGLLATSVSALGCYSRGPTYGDLTGGSVDGAIDYFCQNRAAAAGTSLATAHAALAGERLAAALLAAGRDLARDGLMAALAAAPAPAEHPPEPATLLLPLGPGAGR